VSVIQLHVAICFLFAAFIPMPATMVYTATKHGVLGLSRAAAVSYKSNFTA